jgi:hypothetical protein
VVEQVAQFLKSLFPLFEHLFLACKFSHLSFSITADNRWGFHAICHSLHIINQQIYFHLLHQHGTHFKLPCLQNEMSCNAFVTPTITMTVKSQWQSFSHNKDYLFRHIFWHGCFQVAFRWGRNHSSNQACSPMSF